jgi:hypothetical protein
MMVRCQTDRFCQCLQSALKHHHQVVDAGIFLLKGIAASGFLDVPSTSGKCSRHFWAEKICLFEVALPSRRDAKNCLLV